MNEGRWGHVVLDVETPCSCARAAWNSLTRWIAFSTGVGLRSTVLATAERGRPPR